MAIKPIITKTFTAVEPLPADSYPARLVRIVSLGLQVQDNRITDDKKTVPAKLVDQLLLVFELVTEPVVAADGTTSPRLISKTINNRISPSLFKDGGKGMLTSLTKLYKIAIPTIKSETELGFLDKLIGMTVLLDIGLTASGNNKIIDFSKAPKGTEIAEATAKTFTLDFDEEATAEQLNELPPFALDMIKKAENFRGSKIQTAIERLATVTSKKVDIESAVDVLATKGLAVSNETSANPFL